ncbi:MAG: RNA 2',3'-cyclic phosphodiesterase [Desulfobacteraceae bacterium]|nr:RNA 2',3'-cyclic phosphodiesterase [Desulfobacteraceae bacterium]
MTNKNIRAFIAIALPEKIVSHLRGLQTHLKTYKVKASWPNPSNMHLTLKFLGNIPCSKIQGINHSISATILDFKKENKRLSLSTKGIGVFPSVKKPGIIWSGIQSGIKGQTNRLEMMHSLLEANLEKTDFKKEKKRYFPHITLCRLKQPVSESRITQILKRYSNINSDSFFVNSIILFKSQLTSSGAVHTKLFSEKI